MVIDDSESSESDSEGENAPAARGAQRPGGAAAAASRRAAAEVKHLSEELQGAVLLRVAAERRLREAQAAEAEVLRQLGGQGATPGAAAEGGSRRGGSSRRSARSARCAAPVSYRDDDSEEEAEEAVEGQQPAGRRSSGERVPRVAASCVVGWSVRCCPCALQHTAPSIPLNWLKQPLPIPCMQAALLRRLWRRRQRRRQRPTTL